MSIAPLKIAAACCAAALLTGSIRTVRANEQIGANTQTAYQAPIAPVTRLQVAGAGDSLTLDVERADVQSTLKAVLKQAGKQFVPDATVTGQVTLLLTDQSLDTVLRAVCDSCYLRYTNSPSGVYRFTRDDEAIKHAFGNLKQLNVQLRAQLRALGLDVPTDEQIASARMRSEPGIAGGRGGGLAGASRDTSKQEAATERSFQNGTIPAPAGPAGDVTSNSAAKLAGPAGALKKDAQNKIANIHADFIGQGEVNQFLGQSGRAIVPNAQDYNLLVHQNSFVWFNIPEEKPQPVTSVLQLFSQQSNVPILVDQSIPNGLKFRVWGSLSPRQLPEALNVLAPTAHLQWRWIGNSVFVVPAPNFQIYFGDQGVYRNAYPAPQRGDNSQADGKGRGGQQ